MNFAVNLVVWVQREAVLLSAISIRFDSRQILELFGKDQRTEMTTAATPKPVKGLILHIPKAFCHGTIPVHFSTLKWGHKATAATSKPFKGSILQIPKAFCHGTQLIHF